MYCQEFPQARIALLPALMMPKELNIAQCHAALHFN